MLLGAMPTLNNGKTQVRFRTQFRKVGLQIKSSLASLTTSAHQSLR